MKTIKASTGNLQEIIAMAAALNLKAISLELPEILNRAQQQNISYTQLVCDMLKKGVLSARFLEESAFL